MASNKSKQKNVTQAEDVSKEATKAVDTSTAKPLYETARVEVNNNPVILCNDTEKLVEDELARCYPEHVKYPTSTGLLQCVLKELIRQRIVR